MEDRWYQREAVESLYEYFLHKKGNPAIGLPTGTGKSAVIGRFMQTACRTAPNNSRFMCLTHVKELIEQNAKTLLRMWPQAPVGIYSAGLKRRDFNHQIIFGGRDSVAKCIESFGHVDILKIDEVHLLSPKEGTRYFEIINALRAINPWLKVIGYTATKFRMGQGLITDAGVITDMAYDLTTPEGFMRLVADGYISPPIPKITNEELQTDGVAVSRSTGDFAQDQLQAAVNTDEKNYKMLLEACAMGADRHCWLAFCAGTDHADAVASMLNSFGIPAASVHSKMPSKDRDERIAAFKRGELRCITNNNILTTGFDHPPVDFIIMARPTLSVVLWVQMLGRGTRPYDHNNPMQYIPGFDFTKSNCLVADFARNTRRLGPINDPRIPRKPGEKDEKGDVPTKVCENLIGGIMCGAYNHARNRFCDCCGYEFQFSLGITNKASTDVLLSDAVPETQYFNVLTVIYNKHQKPGSPPGIKATYNCGFNSDGRALSFNHWILLEHDGWASKRSRDWWRQAHREEPPLTTAEALKLLPQLRQPKRIKVHINKKPFPEVLSYEW